jgi:glycerate 2-kinase
MRILIAPDKFRGTLTARQAAEAIATGWRRSRPDDELDLAPMADGGEGTMTALVDALRGQVVPVMASGPRGDPIEASIGVAESTNGRLGIVESAAASGLAVLSPTRRDPLRTTTRGTGELIRAALDRAPRRLIVGLGGTATNDGGAGMAQALGVRLTDADGRELDPGGAALARLARIDATGLDPRVRGLVCVAASDVDNPLTGPNGATAVYGMQKGLSPDDIWPLDRALGHLAAIVERDLGVDLRDEPGAGAAGGLGFGLMAFLGARLRPGVEAVSEALGLPSRMAEAGLAITGEGSLDEQSMRGKVPTGILRLARELSVPAIVVCGRATPGLPLGGVPVVSMAERFGMDASMGDARRSLERLSQELAHRADELVKQRAETGAETSEGER